MRPITRSMRALGAADSGCSTPCPTRAATSGALQRACSRTCTRGYLSDDPRRRRERPALSAAGCCLRCLYAADAQRQYLCRDRHQRCAPGVAVSDRCAAGRRNAHLLRLDHAWREARPSLYPPARGQGRAHRARPTEVVAGWSIHPPPSSRALLAPTGSPEPTRAPYLLRLRPEATRRVRSEVPCAMRSWVAP